MINITTHVYAFYKVKTFTPIGANMLWDLTWPRGSSFCPIRVLNLFVKFNDVVKLVKYRIIKTRYILYTPSGEMVSYS